MMEIKQIFPTSHITVHTVWYTAFQSVNSFVLIVTESALHRTNNVADS